MTRFQFLVRGSQPEPYLCEFTISARGITASCSCPAGQVLQACKHRLAILDGDMAAVIDAQSEDIADVVLALRGTKLQAALQELEQAEARLAEMKTLVSRTKKKVSRIMHEDLAEVP